MRWEKTRLRRKSVLAAAVGAIARDPIILMGIFCDRSSAGDHSLKFCDPWHSQLAGFTSISGAECSHQIGLAGMGLRKVQPELRRHHDPNSVFSIDDLEKRHRSHPCELPCWTQTWTRTGSFKDAEQLKLRLSLVLDGSRYAVQPPGQPHQLDIAAALPVRAAGSTARG